MPLDLDLSQAAKRAGFPQDQATLYWIEPSLTSPLHPYLSLYARTALWCAAPEALDVLEWLEREKGWCWDTERVTASGKFWLAYKVAGTDRRVTSPSRRTTAPELIAAILKKLEGA